MQEGQNVYLKRHGRKEGTKRWSIIIYGKFDEWDVRNYSLELANFEEDDVPDMIDEWYKPDEVLSKTFGKWVGMVTSKNIGMQRCIILVLGS